MSDRLEASLDATCPSAEGHACISAHDLDALEQAVSHALGRASVRELDVLGYGEISCVLAWKGRACKRLPPFDDANRAVAYGESLLQYIDRLRAQSVRVVDSHIAVHRKADGGAIAHCVQPIVAAHALLPNVMTRADEHEATALFTRVVDVVVQGVSTEVGLDAQLSNWALTPDGELLYLDVTTPLLRDASGRNLLDVEVFLSALPWSARGFVRRFLVTTVLDKYFTPRCALLDMLGNLHNQGLADRIPRWLPIVNAHLANPITEREVRRTHAADTMTWIVIHRLLAFERWWTRTVLRRCYPVLLPDRLGDL